MTDPLMNITYYMDEPEIMLMLNSAWINCQLTKKVSLDEVMFVEMLTSFTCTVNSIHD